MKEQLTSISFLIPVYQNEGSIKLTYRAIVALIESGEIKTDAFEALFVNDGSTDKSQGEIDELVSEFGNVRSIRLSRNFGQVAAITTGISFIQSDAVVIMSADLQDPVDLIPRMLKEYYEGYEIIVCSRKARSDSFVNNLTSNFFYKLMHLSNPDIPKGGFDCMFLSKKAYSAINLLHEHNRFFQGDVTYVGFNRKLIEYERRKRIYGKSQWSFRKKLKYFIDGVLSTSYVPIRMMSVLGIIAAFVGFLFLIVIIINWAAGKTPFFGYAAIMGLIICIGGMIMLMLGIIGEYIWRIYDETRNRPVSVIEEMQGFK
jgi:polyisoprenyl-phosphate glycosyltransferase